jgi:hypothetical protein
MIQLLEALGHLYQGYRAAQDAGIWFERRNAEGQAYFLEQFLITRGAL